VLNNNRLIANKFTVFFVSALIAITFVFICGSFFTNYSFILGHQVSLFASIISPFIIAIVLSISIFKQHFYKIPVIVLGRKIANLDDRVILAVLIFFIAAVFLSLSFIRHNSFSSNCDLAIYDQIVWNSAHGRFFNSSLMGDINSLGNHFEPILLFLAPLYWIFPGVIALFCVQSLALATAIIPLYLLSKRQLNNRFLVFVFIFLYLISRGIQGVATFDFHTDCFLPGLIFWAYYFIISGRMRGAAWMCLLMLLCKENAAILVMGFGTFAFIKKETRIFGIALIASGICAWLLVTKFIIPFFSRSQGDYQYYYWLPFGATLWDNCVFLFSHPIRLVMYFFDKEKLEYYLHIFGPSGFLAFLSPAHLGLFMAPITVFVLASSGHAEFLNIGVQYSAHTVPVVMISAIGATAWLKNKMVFKFPDYERKIIAILSLYLIFTGVMLYGKTSGNRLNKFIKAGKALEAREVASILRKKIPVDASVSVTDNLSAHLSNRQKLYLLENIELKKSNQENENISRQRYKSEYVAVLKSPFYSNFNLLLAEINAHGYHKIEQDHLGNLILFTRSVEKGRN